MGMLDGLWHLLNFFAPAFGVGALAAALTKVLWWRELKSVPLRRLAAWAIAVSSVVLVVGLVWTGRDGKMVTYGAMVLMCALALRWAGWGAKRR